MDDRGAAVTHDPSDRDTEGSCRADQPAEAYRQLQLGRKCPHKSHANMRFKQTPGILKGGLR